jgi:CheY-like chemotaxis protein
MSRDESTSSLVHVLLIEDTPEHAILVRTYLAPYLEIALEIVDTLAAGEELLSKDPFDLVLLDLFLPDSSGLATLRRLRQGFPAISVAVLTGLEGQSGEDAALAEGASAFLSKSSLSSQRLIALIRSSITE